MSRRMSLARNEEAWRLNEHLIRFVNAAFGRIFRPSRTLYDAIVTALDAGYTEDDLRLAFWCARCLPSPLWVKDALMAGYDKGPAASPDYVLRFKGGTNTTTGNPARRWLDDLTSRAGEVNPVAVEMVLKSLPQDMQDEERKLLERTGVPIGSQRQVRHQ